MAKESKRKTSVKSALLVLLLITILLVSSTYAWFTANKNLSISSIDVTVAAANGIQISTDANKWKVALDKTDITELAYEGNTNQYPATLAPVSTAKDVAEGKMKMFVGTLAGHNGVLALSAKACDPEAQGALGNFVAFDIFLKVTAPTQVYLTGGEGGSAVTDDKGLARAARVAFVNNGNAADGQDPSIYTGKKDNGTPIIWEPNNNIHSDVAVKNAQGILGQGPELTTTTQMDTIGIKTAIDQGTPINADKSLIANDSSLVTIVNDIKSPEVAAEGTKDNQLINLDAGITKVRIYCWIEGQDIDCENSASGANVKFDLKFHIN